MAERFLTFLDIYWAFFSDLSLFGPKIDLVRSLLFWTLS